MKTLILLDSHAIIHRAYHALPVLTLPKTGEAVQAVYGFTTILLRILRELKPDYIAACFDMAGPTFRHKAYEQYKATRPETPADLISQFAHVKEVVRAFDIPILEKEGYEADDIIGTITNRIPEEDGLEIIIVSGDMDLLQLVRPGVKVYGMRKGITDTVLYDEEGVWARYQLKPSQIVDYKALKGDASDNIKGVKGIGEKTALELITRFGSVEGIYRNLKAGASGLSASLVTKLEQGEKDAFLSKELATIHTSVPVEVNLERMTRVPENREVLRALFQEFGFYSLIKRMDGAEEKGKELSADLSTVVLTKVEASAKAGEGLKKSGTRKAKKEQAAQPSLLDGVPSAGASEDAHADIPAISSRSAFHTFVKEIDGDSAGLILHDNELFLILKEKSAVYRLDGKLFSNTAERHGAVPNGIKRFFESHSFFVFDGKTILRFFRSRDIELKFNAIEFDLMIASYLTGVVSRDFSYMAVLARELGRPTVDDIRGEFVHFFEIAGLLRDKLEHMNMKKVFYDIELPIVRILADMEERGVLIDAAFLKKLSRDFDARIGVLTKQIWREAGAEFNINSTRQLSYMLFEKLGIPSAGLRKTEKGGVVSTGASELEKLKNRHVIIGKILDYREFTKIKTTYVDALPSLVNPRTKRVHTTFNQTGTSTGRLSSSSPNLQNIPIMSEYGRRVRRAFIAPKGHLLVSFDYSQIELRVAAHIAEDARMIEAFKNGDDIHRSTAARIYNVSPSEVTPDLRRAAKTLNFGVLYGMGPVAFAESTGMSRAEAKKFIDNYFRTFIGIRQYVEETKRIVEERGFVETIFGRRRYIPEIYSPSFQLKREAERMAVNMPIQGTAADLYKLAMIQTDAWIREERIGAKARLLLQIHDELLFEADENIVKKIVPKIKGIMESVAELAVPLVVDVKAGKNWGEQEEVKG